MVISQGDFTGDINEPQNCFCVIKRLHKHRRDHQSPSPPAGPAQLWATRASGKQWVGERSHPEGRNLVKSRKESHRSRLRRTLCRSRVCSSKERVSIVSSGPTYTSLPKKRFRLFVISIAFHKEERFADEPNDSWEAKRCQRPRLQMSLKPWSKISVCRYISCWRKAEFTTIFPIWFCFRTTSRRRTMIVLWLYAFFAVFLAPSQGKHFLFYYCLTEEKSVEKSRIYWSLDQSIKQASKLACFCCMLCEKFHFGNL